LRRERAGAPEAQAPQRLLPPPAAARGGAAQKQPRPYWHMFDPDHLLAQICAGFGWLRYLAILIPLGLIAALITLQRNMPLVVVDFQRLWGNWSIVQHLLFAAVSAHLVSAVAKAVVCRGAGAPVPSFGLTTAMMLVPRFWVDTSAATQLDRAGRMWVAATPLIAKLALFAVGVIVWKMTRAGGNELPFFAFTLAVISAITFLLTVNPLSAKDGYEVLANYLELPNLRTLAFQALFGLPTRRPEAAALIRENKLALQAYGLAAALYIAVLAFAILYLLATYLESNFSGTGVAIFIALCLVLGLRTMWKIRRQRQRMARAGTARGAGGRVSGAAMRARFSGALGGGLGGAAEGLIEDLPARQGMRSPRARRAALQRARAPEPEPPSTSTRWLRYGLVLAVLVVMFLPYPYEPGGPLELQPPERQQIHTDTAGEVVKVNYKTGDWVAKGEVIAQLASYEQEKNIQVTHDQIAEQEAAVANAEVKVQYSQREYLRMKQLFASGHVSQKTYDDAKQRSESDRKELEANRAELDRLRNQLSFLEDELERTKLVMPIDGRIVTPYFEQKVGTYLKEGDLLAEAQNTREIYAELQVPESDIGDIAVGSEVRIKVWAYPNEEFSGQVYQIRATAAESSFGRVIPVLTVIPNPNERLKTGMTGYGKVEAGTKPVAVAFTRAIVRFVLIEMWSWLP